MKQVLIIVFVLLFIRHNLSSNESNDLVFDFIQKMEKKYSSYSDISDSVRFIRIIQNLKIKESWEQTESQVKDTILMYFYANIRVLNSKYIDSYNDNIYRIEVNHQLQKIQIDTIIGLNNQSAFENLDLRSLKFDKITNNQIIFSKILKNIDLAPQKLPQALYYFDYKRLTLDSAYYSFAIEENAEYLTQQYEYISLPKTEKNFKNIFRYFQNQDSSLMEQYKSYKVLSK